MALKIQENIRLAPLTTFRIGGPARFFSHARTEDDVVEGLEFARKKDIPVFVLGGGSNLLVSDHGFNGLVIQIGLKGIETDGSLITVAAGENWDGFVVHCVANDLAGVE